MVGGNTRGGGNGESNVFRASLYNVILIGVYTMKKVKVINTAKTTATVDYYYDCKRDTFGSKDNRLHDLVNYGFNISHHVIADSHLTAQQLDVVFNEVLYNEKL